MKSFLRQFTVVFALWTLIALCAGAADYALQLALGRSVPLATVFRRPLTEHWIWAALTPLVFHLARRFPLAAPRRARAVLLHMGFFAALSVLHCVVAEAIGGPLAWLPAQQHLPSIVLRLLEEFYSDLWMYWPLVGICSLLDAHAREREREREAHRLEQTLAATRLSLLRAQIQPHFLFNTLHAISALLRVDPRAAEDMVADLAELLRASFAGGGAQECTLRTELALVDGYLRIQQRRLGERLSIVREIDPGALDAALPALALQPLVEDAVVHGIAVVARPCTLTLRVCCDGDRLRLEIGDDGAGMDTTQRAGIGIANARERFMHLYGAAHAFELTSQPGQGTRITIHLPLHTLAPAADRGPEDHVHSHSHRGRRTAGAAEPVVAP